MLRYGVDAFARDLAAAGGLGLITPDLIPDEADEWLAASDAARPGPDLPGRARRPPPERHRADRRRDARGFLYATVVDGRDRAPGTPSATAAPELVARVPAAHRRCRSASGSGSGPASRPRRSRRSPTA